MRIQESNLQLTASHEASYSQSMEIERISGFRQIFGETLNAQPGNAKTPREQAERLLQQLIDAILAAMDGKKYTASAAAGDTSATTTATPLSLSPQPTREMFWQESVTETISESEKTQVCGSGKVCTADGRQIAFDFSLDMARSYQHIATSQQSGSIRLQDPLMLSFDGHACDLSSQRMDFDLDADGKAEQVPMAGEGCGFLVFDRNGNGRADNGQELFGVASGNGFADLQQYDSDRNGWIDEADPVFKQLAVWSQDGLKSLQQAGVGALNLSAVDAPFTLKTDDNHLLGEIRAAGIYLSEGGQIGHLQQVDLAVSALPAGTQQPGERGGLPQQQEHENHAIS